MDRYDLDELKQAARGQWESIFGSLCGVSLDILDGHHHPCPRCSQRTTDDRFRMIDKSAGALYCNQCFKTKNGDGIAALMWLLNCDFKDAMSMIGQHLGVKPLKRINSKDPAAKLEFVEWNELLAAGWCLKKQPIKQEALTKIGARMAIYRKQFKVIAIPVWIGKPNNIVGWNLYNVTGGTLPKFKPDKTVEQVKVKLTFGSKPGLMGCIELDSELVHKTEGPTDLLALISIEPDGSVICNANGAQENPARAFGWLPSLLDGKEIRIIHDCDEPGQQGAMNVIAHDGSLRPGWGQWLANNCRSSVVKNIVLPYQIEPTHGKDLRDWLTDGYLWPDLDQLADEFLAIEQAEEEVESEVWEADDDPHRLARINLQYYRSKHGGRLLLWRDEWWKYKQGVYRRISTRELRPKVNAAIRKEFVNAWKEKNSPNEPVRKVGENLVSNVIAAMASQACLPDSVVMPSWIPTRQTKNYVSLRNGMLDLDAVLSGEDLNNCLVEHSANWFSAFKLDYKFDPSAECPKWLAYLDRVMEQDDERIQLLQEWAGYLLTQQNEYQKFLILEGEGKNGKTVFFAGITAMLGTENVSHLSMENFGGRFDLGATLGKAANISGDVGEIDHMSEGILKQFTGGDMMQFDRKHVMPVQARPTAKLMASWNSRPRIKDRSDGLWRRMLLVPFRYRISETERIFGMDSPQWWIDSGESPGMFLWALAGLNRLRKANRFTRCSLSKEVLDDYKLDSNPAGQFLTEYIHYDELGDVDSKLVYDAYRHWCEQSNYRPLGTRQFGKELHKMFPLVDRVKVRRGSKLFWHYKKIDFSVSEIFGKSFNCGDVS